MIEDHDGVCGSAPHVFTWCGILKQSTCLIMYLPVLGTVMHGRSGRGSKAWHASGPSHPQKKNHNQRHHLQVRLAVPTWWPSMGLL